MSAMDKYQMDEDLESLTSLKISTTTEDQVEDLLKQQCRSMPTEVAKKFQESIRDKMNGINIDPQRNLILAESADETLVGSFIYQGVQSLIRQGGPTLKAIILTDFDVDGYITKKRQILNQLETDVQRLKEIDDTDMEAPDLNLHNLRKDHKIKKEQKKLREEFILMFGESMRTSLPKSGVETRSSSKESTEITFESSPEYKEMIKAMKEIEDEISMEYDEEFLVNLAKFEELKKEKKVSKGKIEKLEYHKSQELVMELVLQGFQLALSKIGTMIKDAVKYHTTIASKLNDRVQLDQNKKTINGPLRDGNVAGLYQLLHNLYSKPSMVIFSRMLHELITVQPTAEEINNHPERVMLKFFELLKKWDAMGLYEFMTKDRLFTICMIKAYSSSTHLHLKMLEHLFEYIRSYEEGRVIISDHDLANATPFLDETSSWIRSYTRSIKFDTKTELPAASTSDLAKKRPSNYPRNHPTGKQFDSAASATASASASASAATDDEKRTVAWISSYTKAQHGYNRQVNRDEKLYVERPTGEVFLYTATENPCPICQDKNKTNRHPIPNCYQGKCSVCGLYGHNKVDCHQK